MELCLYRPDIPQNLGTLIRLSACLDMQLHIIKPCAFPLSHEKLKRSAMDYADLARVVIHENESDFFHTTLLQRKILMTTKYKTEYTEFSFQPSDILVAGRESAGVPADFAQKCDALIGIRMANRARSLNVAVASAMIIGEAFRQTVKQTVK